MDSTLLFWVTLWSFSWASRIILEPIITERDRWTKIFRTFFFLCSKKYFELFQLKFLSQHWPKTEVVSFLLTFFWFFFFMTWFLNVYKLRDLNTVSQAVVFGLLLFFKSIGLLEWLRITKRKILQIWSWGTK